MSGTHIVFAVDSNYAQTVAPMIMQLRNHGTQCASIKVVVPRGFNLEDKKIILHEAKKRKYKLDFIETDVLEELKRTNLINDRTHVSSFTYVKLFFPEILKDLNQILYLDTDLLIRKSIQELVDWKLRNPVGAISELSSNSVHLFGSDSNHYFNAGVLRMSLAACRKIKMSNKARKIIMNSQDLEFQDQDVFNLIFKNTFDVLPQTFNAFNDNYLSNQNLPSFRDPTIVHFNGQFKPWTKNSSGRFTSEWRNAYGRYFKITYNDSTFNQNSHNEPLEVYNKSLKSKLGSFAAKKIMTFRFSVLGVFLRKKLPYRFKKLINDAVYAVYHQHGSIKDVLDQALFNSNESKHISESEFIGGETKFLYLVSQPRSGTNAFLAMLEAASPQIVRAGEIFTGHASSNLFKAINQKYPWYKNLSTEELSNPRKIRNFRAKVEKNLEGIFSIIKNENDSRGKVVVIKIFPNHLSSSIIRQMFFKYPGEVIFLRRRLLYSYLSFLKASQTDSWQNSDSSAVSIPDLKEEYISEYCDASIFWYSEMTSHVLAANLRNLSLEYEKIFEEKDDIKKVVAFITKTFLIKNLEFNLPKTVRQDQRFDNFISDVLVSFANFEKELQSKLLRVP